MGAKPSRTDPRDLAEKQLTDYVILEELGRGAFGQVYKCQRKSDPTKFLAVKQIRRNKMDSKYLFGEGSLMTSLPEKSPHFVELIDFRNDKYCEFVYAIMEYCDGGDLQEYLEANRCICELRLRAICGQIGKAMEVMLQQNVIHRDIKPQNILLCKADPRAAKVDLLDCTVKLTDFGVATIAEKSCSPRYGTNDYMAPEVIKCISKNTGECSYDAKCDMFSLGVVMYQCVTMELPFSRPSNIHGQESSDLIPMTRDQEYDEPSFCTVELRDLIRQLLEADPTKRISADKFLSHQWFTRRFGAEIFYQIMCYGIDDLAHEDLIRELLRTHSL